MEFSFDSLFLSTFWRCHHTVFWPLYFLMRNQLLMLLRILYMQCHFPLAASKIFFLSDFYQFHYVSRYGSLWVYSTWASWMYRLIFFIKFVMFWPLSLPVVLLRLPLCACWYTDVISHVCETLFLSLHSFFFLLFIMDNLYWHIINFTLLFCQIKSVVEPLKVYFSLQLLYVSTPDFLFDSLLWFLFCETLFSCFPLIL